MRPVEANQTPESNVRWPLARRVRILYVITQAVRGGAQTHVLNLIMGLRDRCDLELACGEEGFLTNVCRNAGIPVYIVPQLRRSGDPFSDLRSLIQLRAVMKQVCPDLVHTHTFKAGFVGRFAAWTLRIPSVYTIHAWLWGTEAVSKLESKLAIPLERLAAGWCDRIITVSAAGEKCVRAYGLSSPDKHVTVHNGISDRGLGRRRPASTPVIAMVARFVPGKDYEQLICAYAKLASKARLWLIGDGETQPRMEQLVRSTRLEGRVEFLGDRDDVAELLEQADIFALASESEMFPVSILEAMRAGLPVVASDVGGVAEAVEDGVTGTLVPKGSVERFSEALARLLSDSESRERMGRAGRTRFEALFESSAMQEKTYAVYLETLRARSVASADGRSSSLFIELSETPLIEASHK
jgi:glycosyltransferase involved in cell wall biosynthesis